MLSAFFNSLLLLLSLTTATGLFLHDTRLDKATTVAIAPPAPLTGYEPSAKLLQIGELHTHVERGSIAHTLSALHSAAPGMQSRMNEDKKHLLQRHAPKGHHAFDNYYLPIV